MRRLSLLTFAGLVLGVTGCNGTTTSATSDDRTIALSIDEAGVLDGHPADWDATRDTNDIAAYRAFIEKHPNSPHVTDAQYQLRHLGRLAELSEKADRPADWAAAERDNSVQAYENFRLRHPNGRNSSRASTRAAILRREHDWIQKQQSTPADVSITPFQLKQIVDPERPIDLRGSNRDKTVLIIAACVETSQDAYIAYCDADGRYFRLSRYEREPDDWMPKRRWILFDPGSAKPILDALAATSTDSPEDKVVALFIPLRDLTPGELLDNPSAYLVESLKLLLIRCASAWDLDAYQTTLRLTPAPWDPRKGPLKSKEILIEWIVGDKDLSERLSSEDPEILRTTLLALGLADARESWEHVVGFLQHDDEALRMAAVKSLLLMESSEGVQLAHRAGPTAATVLIRALLRKEVESVHIEALGSLSRLKGSAINALFDSGGTNWEHLAFELVESMDGEDSIPPLLDRLLIWHRRAVASRLLHRASWRPESNEDHVHWAIATSRRRELLVGWDRTRRVLLEDIRSQCEETRQFAAYALIWLGRDETIDELLDLLENETSGRSIAAAYANSGHERLEAAAQRWAGLHGYAIHSRTIPKRPLSDSSAPRWRGDDN